MASTDAKPVPQKNVAYRVTFPILDADGDLVTGATALDSEVSKDGGAFADATSEATEIATNSGVYYLDLTATEMNADTVAIIVKTSSSGAKTTTLVMYPEEAGDIRVNVTAYGGTAGTFSAGRPEVNTTHAAGTAWGSGAITAASIAADAITDAKVASDVTIASVTGAVGSVTGAVGSVTGAVGSVTGNVGGSVASIATGGIAATSFAAGAIDAAAIATGAIDADAVAADAVTEIQSGLATAAALTTVAGYLDTEIAAILADTNELQTDWADGGRLDLILDARASQTSVDDLPTNAELATALGTADDAVLAAIAALNNLSAAQVNAEVVDALATDTYAEPGQGAPAATASLAAKLGYLYKAWRNKVTQTDLAYSLYDDAGTTVDQKATTSDDGITFTRTEIASGP